MTTPGDLHSDLGDPPPRRLIGISLLPAAATLGNLVCGFLAIFCCLLAMRAEYAEWFDVQPRVLHPRLEQLFPTHIAAGAYLLILAMIFDALDGRLARMTRRTSEFGAQLDSLSDVVSFGVAPMMLIVALLLRPDGVTAAGVPDESRVVFRIGMLAILVYLSCAAIRLARYNAENVRSEEGQRAFSGLPAPGAAALIIALVALHEHLRDSGWGLSGTSWNIVVSWCLVGATLLVGLLMVSRYDYVHVFNVYVRRKRPPSHLVWFVAIIALGWYQLELLLVILALAYVSSGPLLAYWPRPPAMRTQSAPSQPDRAEQSR